MRFRKVFHRSGLKNFTIIRFSGTGHILERSMTGYEDDPSIPERMVKDYPDVMIHWLDTR